MSLAANTVTSLGLAAGDAPGWSDGTNPDPVPPPNLSNSTVCAFSCCGLQAGPTTADGWETVGRAKGNALCPLPAARCVPLLNSWGPSTCHNRGLQRGAGSGKSCHMCWGMNGLSKSPGTQ